MTEAKRTAHGCPICREIIYNNIVEFRQHLNTVCAQTLFSKYPGLQNETFNALWHKLNSMVKDSTIIPSGQKGVSAIVHQSQQPPPSHYNYQYHNKPYQHHQQRHVQRAMDLEDIDRDIELRERNRINQRKRIRYQMEQEINLELKNDEFNQAMPKIDDNHKNKKRRLLYHNTSDI